MALQKPTPTFKPTLLQSPHVVQQGESNQQLTFFRWVLVAAGVYNVVWGSWVVFFPQALFDWTGTPLPTYLEIWQCVGMIVGVFGIGYLAAAIHPLRHWPIVLVGLLGKILGPIGFVKALWDGVFPLAFGITILTNDLIWWIPFAMMLITAYHHWLYETDNPPVENYQSLLGQYHDQYGASLLELSCKNPLILVFLRHSGCTFCREAIDDVAKAKEHLDKAGYSVAFVHMGDPTKIDALLAESNLTRVRIVHDPQRQLYKSFGMRRGDLGQLLGLSVWIRGVEAGIFKGFGVGALDGDGFQMPGVIVLHNGKIMMSHRYQSAAERFSFHTLEPVASST